MVKDYLYSPYLPDKFSNLKHSVNKGITLVEQENLQQVWDNLLYRFTCCQNYEQS
jgi:hypothetical protein